MSEKINNHTEGDTYVIPEVNVTAIGNADVKRPDDNFEWDDLLLMENSNQAEATYEPPKDVDEAELQKTLARAKRMKVGARVLALFGETV